MIDPINQKLQVVNDKLSGPYIWVTIDQIERVQKILQDNDIPHWVDHHAVSVDGGPFLTVININQKCDPNRVQAFLDAAG